MTKKKKSEEIVNKDYIVYSGIFNNGKIENILSFKGNKKEVLEFMNKNYQKNEVICYFENKTVFCFEEDINNINNWKTVTQLIEEDIIEVKEGKK